VARKKDPALEQRRRVEIMQTTRHLLTTGSIAGLTMARVARQTGVSKGLLSYYFGSKDQLIVETIRQYHAEQAAALQGIAALDLPAEAKLELIVEATLPSQEAVQDELRFQVEVFSFAKEQPEVLDAVRGSYRAFRDACEALLQQGIDEGTVQVDDVGYTYRVMHALIDGLSLQLAVEDQVDMVALRRHTVALFRGLLGPGPLGQAATRPR